jgi:L-aspartate oxidase
MTRLPTGRPGWSTRADVIVIGSGVAGLTTALQLRGADLSVLLVTKDVVDAGSTRWAQGGIAAALGPGDSPDQHEMDTLTAGAGLCDRDAVRVLVTEGPAAVRRLIERGAVFDKATSGEISLTREGGHHRDRIIHAGGDATGAEVSRALLAAVTQDPGIEVLEHALVIDALKNAEGEVCGVTLHVIGEGQRDGVGQALARAVVIATGGLGQIYAQTTNPPVSTGDGVALALRAGADVADLEFVQFHPTVMYLGLNSQGQQPLISEAVRGEGAFLVDFDGHKIMEGIHPLADLAPRDVVAKAIMRAMMESGRPHMWLDGRGIAWEERFPTILASCLKVGIDPHTDLIPVAPAAHYASGGVRVDLRGRSSIRGLYVCGESACTGVHGANRLASNSLLEGLVFGARIADDLKKHLPESSLPVTDTSATIALIDPKLRSRIADAMSKGAGVLRSSNSLRVTLDRLQEISDLSSMVEPCVEAWETTNLHLIAIGLTRAALRRAETRGSHWREDFPETSPKWQRRIVERYSGEWSERLEEVL